MTKNYFSLVVLLFFCFYSQAQIVINEIDSDTPSTDDKEFIELKSLTPNFSLNGYVVVFFNGNPTSNRSYFTVSLNGLTTDENGLILIGNTLVSPVPERIFGNNVIQNGPDAVAIYQGSYEDFPEFTLATQTNLIHAMAYGNNTTWATELMDLLGLTMQYNENGLGQGTNHSLQRKPDGTYEAKLPTPGAENDGSGYVYNGITISVSQAQYNEGDSFNLTFTTQTPVSNDLTFTYSLSNETFGPEDFIGTTTVFIPTGSTSFSTTIQIIDDTLDEGDELIKINFGTLPFGFVRMNDNVEVRIIDNDFTTAPWGTPLNPTYGIVASSAPEGYYDSLEGKSGALLKQAVQDIIANPVVVRAHNYGDIVDILKAADQNPLNSNEVWLMYKEVNRAKFLYQGSESSSTGRWNREHIYPQSRGGFANATSSTADGIEIWEASNADIIAHGHADAHHLRAEDGPENSSRGNSDYGPGGYTGFIGNQGSWKGDVARAVFYMAVRYNALDVVNGNPADTTVGQLGDLVTLLQWNASDPSDDFEMNRNNYIYTWQINRNPFIDHPTLADYIWGANVGQAWSSLSVNENENLAFILYPNPAKNLITISGIDAESSIDIYSISGQKLMHSNFVGTTSISLDLASGIYFAKIESQGKSAVRKIVIQ